MTRRIRIILDDESSEELYEQLASAVWQQVQEITAGEGIHASVEHDAGNDRLSAVLDQRWADYARRVWSDGWY